MGLLLYTGLWQVAWCYTRDPTKRWGFCSIPDCDRQPRCYTRDPTKKWDFCSIPDCGRQPGVIHETPQRDGTFALYRTVVGSLGVIHETPQRDGTFALYRTVIGSLGVIPETPQRNGTFALYRTVVCSLVLYTRPHKEMGLLRYTGLWQVAWCYTRDPTKRWDFCSIPDCGRQPGFIHETPQRDGTLALYRTVVGSLVLYTRPRKEMGLLLYTGLWQVAWCYTRDPTKRWDFCSIPDCGRQPGVIHETPQIKEMGLLLYTGLWQVACCYTRDPTKRQEFCSIPDCGMQRGVIKETP